MPQKVYNNVVGHRVLDGTTVCEDVTSVTLPTITHPTTKFDAAGMAMAVEMPQTAHLDAMDFSISHNNGTNCHLLGTPGKHIIETRVVRQCYDVAGADIGHKQVKYRITGAHVSTEKGKIETGNPYGSTEKYSVLRYEEIIDGTTTVLVDAMGSITFNGVSFTDPVESLLK